MIHRTLKPAPSPQETALAGTLIGILSRNIHDLPGIVAALNASRVLPAAGEPWSEASFQSEMERLGAFPNSSGAPLGEHKPGTVPPGTAGYQT
jgi:hypothetical protein